MGKLPAIQFYPGDWRKDSGIQALNYHEKGVWMEILFFMHESEQRGKLLLKGKPVPEDRLSRMLHLDKQETNTLINTFLSLGVADTCPDTGALMNRRMVRDEAIREQKAEAGRTGGGNPNFTKGKQNPYIEKDKQNDKQDHKQDHKQSDKQKGGSSVSSSVSVSSSSSNLKTHNVRDNFEEDWNLYPRKAGNKKKARFCYHKSVGDNPEKRKAFLAKMESYVKTTDLEFLQHGETFFRNWESLEVDTVRTRAKGSDPPSPMAQALISRGEFVDRVTGRAESLSLENPEMDTETIANMVLKEFEKCNESKKAAKKILTDFQWVGGTA